jgi:hypothetical protein
MQFRRHEIIEWTVVFGGFLVIGINWAPGVSRGAGLLPSAALENDGRNIDA